MDYTIYMRFEPTSGNRTAIEDRELVMQDMVDAMLVSAQNDKSTAPQVLCRQ